MSRTSKESRYWYFRFTKDFFRDKAVRDLKQIPIIGYQFGWIYLEMCALCLEDGSDVLAVPKYTSQSSYTNYIAGHINEEVKIVEQAISYFVTNGFIEILHEEDVTKLSFIQMRNNIGKSSKNADRVRAIETKQRELLLESAASLDAEKAKDESRYVRRRRFLTRERGLENENTK